MLIAGLAGRQPSPLLPLRARRPGREAEPVMARPVRVTEVVRETPDAVSLHLVEADGSPISFVPGEFLTVEVTLDGRRLRRAYSLSSAVLPGHSVRVTPKRLRGGRVSTYLNERVRPGDLLRVLGPSGTFALAPEPTASRRLVLLAGGSGITPLASVAESVLGREPESRVALIYGNRRLTDVIFRARLDELARAHGNRFVVDHVLAEPPDGWTGAVGLLDVETIAARLDAVGIADGPDVLWLLCGPTPMMDAARTVLRGRGVDGSRIRQERYLRPESRTPPGDLPTTPQPMTVRSGQGERTIRVQPGQTILEAGRAAGLPMKFSCAMGGCAACRVRLRDGAVAMDEPNCLSEAERGEGFVLACVSRPRGPLAIDLVDP